MTSQCTAPGGDCLNLNNGNKGPVCTPSCDPIANTGCLPGDSCRIFTPGSHSYTFCGGTGQGGQDDFCNQGDHQCQVGFECVAYTFNAYCEQICTSNGMCPPGYGCHLAWQVGSTVYGSCE